MKIDSFQGAYRFLSNFAPCQVELDYATYRSVEHAYQAAKTLNQRQRDRIASMITPADAKREGQEVYIRHDWDTIKIGVMLDLLRQKFNQPDFKAAMLATGNAELIEGNWWGDTFWGVYNGKGENHLGKLLMQVRSELKG